MRVEDKTTSTKGREREHVNRTYFNRNRHIERVDVQKKLSKEEWFKFQIPSSNFNVRTVKDLSKQR